MSNNNEFPDRFQKLTGNQPMTWQTRLFDLFVANKLESCSLIDLPTGLGKTMVMAIWLIARCQNRELPRRLIYVVDRRTVVDQASDLAISLQCKAKQLGGNAAGLAISTLRGQRADSREWTQDPSRPAIVVGTVDLIGSGLLFSGYRSSYKRRPLEAGFLGQDSLLVLDEAHLSRPFDKLLGEIQQFTAGSDPVGAVASLKPMRVICMSATSGEPTKALFTLQFDAHGNLMGKDADDKTIIDRYGASKTLTVVQSEKPVEAIATEADKLATEKPGSRLVIFVQTPKQVAEVRKMLEKKNKDYAQRIALLTGTMRGLERDELVDSEKPLADNDWERRVMQRFLKPDNDASQNACFLISTSAGEVGFDLNADHLVGDEAPLDSWIQRLGRVNRRGTGEAKVILIKKKEPAGKTDFDKACAAASQLLTSNMDVSPKGLAVFKKSLTSKQYNAAISPKPTTVELTDILLDAWSMTSITQPMPGRPEVAPWLRGIDNEQAETSVAWRAELELFTKPPSPERAHPHPEKALKAVFAKHRLRPHECVTTYTSRVVDFLKEAVKPKGGRPDLLDTPLAVRFPRGDVVILTIAQLIKDPGILFAEPTLILPAMFGGLDSAGMLSTEAIPPAPGPKSFDVADYPGYEQRDDATPRLRLVIRRTDEGNWVPQPLPGGPSIDRLNLEESYDRSDALFVDLRKSLRIRLVEPVEFDDYGDAVRSLVMLAPISNKSKLEDQALACHVEDVEKEARGIAERLILEGPFRDALLFAARWHDEGKKADIWQRYVCADPSVFKGKSSKTRDPKSLRGYRHEFGSLMRAKHPERFATDCKLLADAEARDLALHLIATHHGFGRPHFDNPIDRDFQTKQCEAVHTEAIRRFARLQRKYGWWQLAWLENLLRCADALASADQDPEDDPVDLAGGSA